MSADPRRRCTASLRPNAWLDWRIEIMSTSGAMPLKASGAGGGAGGGGGGGGAASVSAPAGAGYVELDHLPATGVAGDCHRAAAAVSGTGAAGARGRSARRRRSPARRSFRAGGAAETVTVGPQVAAVPMVARRPSDDGEREPSSPFAVTVTESPSAAAALSGRFGGGNGHRLARCRAGGGGAPFAGAAPIIDATMVPCASQSDSPSPRHDVVAAGESDAETWGAESHRCR